MKTTCTNLMRLFALALFCLFAAAGLIPAQTPASPAPPAAPTRITSTPLQVDRADPASSRIVPANAKLDRVATGFTWVEGPVWVNGSLFFAEIPSNSIRTWTPGKGTSIFLQPSGYKGTAAYGGPESGSNGMTSADLGRRALISCTTPITSPLWFLSGTVRNDFER